MDTRKGDPYICCLVGCLFSTDKHRNYLKHLKEVHFKHDQLVCKFKKQCVRQFSSISLLLEHVKESHSLPSNAGESSQRQTQADVECQCDLLFCGGMKFRNTAMLLTHINTYHATEDRCCVFDQCETKFSRGSTSRNHFRLKHTSKGQFKLKSKHLVVPEHDIIDEIVDEDLPLGDTDDYYEDNDASLLDVDSVHAPADQEEVLEENFFQMQYADFLNKLCNFGFIPAKRVTEIAENYLQNALKSKDIREIKLRKSLNAILVLTESQKEKIVKDVIDDDEYLNAQKELCSEFKRTKFIQQNFKYVAPVQIILNSNEVTLGASPDVFHYVPIKESFRQLIEDKSLNDVLESQREMLKKNDDVSRDLRDGEAYKNNPFFKKNPGAFAALFYSDGVELTNPLGWAKGRHKIVQVFYTISQIPRSQRSQIDRTQVCMIFKEKLVKKYGYEAIFRLLVQDLKDLEIGITVTYPVERQVQLGLLAYSADNLEAHLLGGFSCCFSSFDICRFCHCLHSELLENIHDNDGDGMKKYWSKEEYDSVCRMLEGEDEVEVEEDSIVAEDDFLYAADGGEESDKEIEDEIDCVEIVNESGDEAEGVEESDQEIDDEIDCVEIENESDDASNDKFGLRKRCPLNKLEAFHAVNSFPPDCMHDLLEGFVAQDLCGGIKILCLKGWFTLEGYNERMKKLGYSSYEANDKPQEITKKAKKLPGKACSLWVHARNFPLIIKDMIEDSEDDVLSLLLLLVEITARITCTEIRDYEVDDLEWMIVKYLDKRKAIYTAFPQIGTPKPKHHYLR